MNTLYIIRGLPGSGKTTLAQELGYICEADDFFLQPDGSYLFDGAKLPDAHLQCQDYVNGAMIRGERRIVVSNTFSCRWEMLPYEQMALEYHYRVVEITMTGQLHSSVHNVPPGTIQKMRERWEV